MRKLMLITSLILLMIKANHAQNNNNHQQQQQYSVLPHYQTNAMAELASEGSLYLPPDTPTTLPLFPLKTSNLPYQYLPPTGTKAPSIYPSPFPITMSSPFVPNFDDDDEDDNEEDNNKVHHMSSPHTPFKFRPNRTQINNDIQNQVDNRKDMRLLPRTVSYAHPIDRVDIKFPQKFGPSLSPQFNMQSPATRRMIISPETVKSEPLMGDQVKTPSYQGIHYLQPPPGFVSSTTEPAIPILRLSNEMDLDGSYSYEALGADQTHYVQHSRMENTGTDKEEQVVEGSYSYVGDNGQTYTVHYVADANGFRASGDHLPVGPPVPEIIQRSIQYNLAEEAKRPHHLQEWHDDEKSNEIDIRDRTHRFAISQAPQRNLFTGRAPEAFSYNFAKAQNSQNNNVVPAPSSPSPVIVHPEQPKEQVSKQNNAPIAPQITFLASQGAHVPSLSPAAPQQSISRVFNTNMGNMEKPQNMPKIMSYEFTTNENEHENSKPLWRWQYGLNANAAKNSISRSSTHSEDEVTLNFNEMTPEQYRHMIQSQFDVNVNDNSNDKVVTSTEPINKYESMQENNDITQYNSSPMQLIASDSTNSFEEKTQAPILLQNNWYSEHDIEVQRKQPSEPSYFARNTQFESREVNYPRQRSNLITQNDFIPQSQTVTQSYDYDEHYYEPRKLKSSRHTPISTASESYKNSNNEDNIEKPAVTTNVGQGWYSNDAQTDMRLSTITSETFSNYVTPNIIHDANFNEFKPSQQIPETNKSFFIESEKSILNSTTTENPMEDILKDNIFLKNLLHVPKTVPEDNNKKKIEEPFKPINDTQSNITINSSKLHTNNDNKMPKTLHSNQKTVNELKFVQKKPLDMSDILNYVAMKNNFESNKIRPKSQKNLNYQNRLENPIYMFPLSKLGEDNPNVKVRNEEKEHIQERPAGIVKKYKTLQRNNNYNIDQNNEEHLRKDLIPPGPDFKTLNVQNLPPLGRAGPTLKSYLPPIFV